MSPHMSLQYGELRPTSGWDSFISLGTPANVNGFRILAALLHSTLVVGVSQALQRSTEGATHIRQSGHHVGHWPIFLVLMCIGGSCASASGWHVQSRRMCVCQPRGLYVCTMYYVTVRLAESNCLLMEYLQSHQGCLRTLPLATDYLPALRAIARAEDVRKATSRKRRSDSQISLCECASLLCAVVYIK